MEFTLTEYINAAMALAEYDKLDDGSFAGRLPKCKGVIAFAKTLKGCEDELRSTLEDWIIVGLKLGHRLPEFRDVATFFSINLLFPDLNSRLGIPGKR